MIVLLALLLLASPAYGGTVWDCAGSFCQHLDARGGDSFDATDADSSIPGPVESSAPSCTIEGEVYFNSTDHFLYCCDGSSWAGCSAAASDTNTWCGSPETCDETDIGLTLSGNTAEVATVSSKTASMCAEWDASGNLVADSAACNSGGGGGDHGGLTGLGDDDHTQYALLAGRSGGQDLIGGTDDSDDLTLESTSHATKGVIQTKSDIDLYPARPDNSGTDCNTTPCGVINSSATWTNQSSGNSGVLYFGDDITFDGVGAIFGMISNVGTLRLGGAATTLSSYATVYDATRVLAVGSNVPLFTNVSTFWGNTTFESETASRNPLVYPTFLANPNVKYSAASGTVTASASTSFSSSGRCTVTDATAGSPTMNCSVTDYTALEPTLDASQANNTVTVTARVGYDFLSGYALPLFATSPGTQAITEEWGMRLRQVDTTGGAGTSHGFYNELTTEFPPEENVIAASTTLSPVKETAMDLCVGTCANTAGNITWAGTGSEMISDGLDGQVLYLINADAADTITMTDGNNVQLPNGNDTLSPGEGITVIWSDEADIWVALVLDTSGGGGGGSTVTSDQASITGTTDACSVASIPETTLTTVATLADYDNTGASTLLTGTACFTFGATRTITLTMEIEATTVATTVTTMTSGESTCMTISYLDTTSASTQTVTIRGSGSAGSGSPTHSVDGCFLTRMTHD